MQCIACKSPYHEATGHVMQYDPLLVLCGPCARSLSKWMKGMMNRKWNKLKFYEHAIVKPDENNPEEVWIKYEKVPDRK